MLLDVPPRFMWGWGHNVSGYCGSMSIQTVGLYYGNYLSQDKVRGMTGGHDGRHEIMLGSSACCSAARVMDLLKLNVSQWPFWSAARPQSAAFVSWMRKSVAAREPVVFGVFMQTENNPVFDHIVPLVGFEMEEEEKAASTSANTSSGGRLVVFNDLHSSAPLRRALPSFVASRSACRAALPWPERFAYCLPAVVSNGVRVHGNADVGGELYPARLIMDSWSEPDYSDEDGKREAPTLLGATLHATALEAGRWYCLLEFRDAAHVPQSGFLRNQTGGLVTRLDFEASRSGTFARRVSFMSNATVFFRVVRRPEPGSS
jgi:hypothetical protein